MIAETLTLSPKEFRDRFALGGYWWTLRVDQTVGAYLARAGIRVGLHPNQVTLLMIVVGIVTSALTMVAYDWNRVASGIIGWTGWNLAYCLDCADGQIARATGMASPRGALLDLLCDFVLHVLVVMAGVYVVSASMQWDVTLISVAITAAWLVAPYYKGVLELLPQGMKSTGASPLYKAFRHTRDFGLYVFILPLAIVFGSLAVLVFLLITSALEFAALIRGIWLYSRRDADLSPAIRRSDARGDDPQVVRPMQR